MKIFILVDALRSDYISEKNTPFLYDLANKYFYIKKVKPSLGFCERSEIISGLNSEKTGFFTAIGKNNQKSEYINMSKMMVIFFDLTNLILKKIPVIKVFNRRLNWSKAFKKTINNLLTNKYNAKMSTYNIPYNQLNNFYLTEDEIDHFSKKFFSKNSLVNKILSKNIPIDYDAWTYLGKKNQMSLNETKKYLLNKSKSNKNEFVFSYLGSLDVIGHKYGPQSKEMKKELEELDMFFNKLIESNKNNTIIILGDHGMKTIESYFNIERHIIKIRNDLGLKINQDFNYFIDSTMCRIWIRDDFEKDVINYFNEQEELTKNGKVIYPKVSKKIYGDIIWLANEGVMLYPDFFHFNKPFGMHGYDNSLLKSQGTCIIYSYNGMNINIENENLSNINEIIMKDFV